MVHSTCLPYYFVVVLKKFLSLLDELESKEVSQCLECLLPKLPASQLKYDTRDMQVCQ